MNSKILNYFYFVISNVFGMMGFYTPFVYLPNMAQQYVSRQIDRYIYIYICRQIDRKIDRQIDSQTDRQTDRKIERQTSRFFKLAKFY